MKFFIAFVVSLSLLSRVSAEILFQETFDENPFDSGRFFISNDEKYAASEEYVRWKAQDKPIAGFEHDKGLQLTKDFMHYGVAHQFERPIFPHEHDMIVIQYQLKLEESLTCGGAYIKLFRPNDMPLASFNGATPYSIMFGPDRCGVSDKIHFIIQYQNPTNMEWEEKHWNETTPTFKDLDEHLYTLVIRKDNSFQIFVDSLDSDKLKGNLLTHFIPSINPPAEIDDPDDVKPDNWVDISEIVDATAVKPDDWDEDQPNMIPNPDATKPANWDEDEPETIPDPSAVRPEGWDDEEDGEWEKPTIPNPKCGESGCGKWTAPMMRNPLYKGRWSPPLIPNPDYKGVWAPRKIANPHFFETESPFDSLAPLVGIGVEIWTTVGGIFFDNFIVTNSMADVGQFAYHTFRPKNEAQKEHRKKIEEEEKASVRKSMIESSEWTQVIMGHVMSAYEYLYENPVALAVTVAISVGTLGYLLLFGGQDPKIEMELAEAAAAADAARLASSSSSGASSESKQE